MLDRTEIIKLLSQNEWQKDSYWISSGAGLVLHGVRKHTADIDIGCTTKMMNWLIKNNIGIFFEKHGRAIRFNDFIEIFENWVVDELVMIEGFPVASLQSIRKQKLILGREKDMADIKEIDKFIE